MTDIIYDYPQSSCKCYNCSEDIQHSPSNGIPTNLSVRNCNVSSYYDCHFRKQFGNNIQPNPKTGFKLLNPQAMLEKYSPEFQKMKCRDDKNCSTVYASNDPRLIDIPRSQVMPLNLPPIDGSVPLIDVNTSSVLNNYGQGYRTYSDINAGQITYYVDKSIEDPFFKPNFVTSAEMSSAIYKDPMGGMKPQYERFPLKCNNPINTDNTQHDYCLSWMDDTTSHREDIMARQMRKRNEQRWEPRWV
jgi:ribosomal protein S27E